MASDIHHSLPCDLAASRATTSSPVDDAAVGHDVDLAAEPSAYLDDVVARWYAREPWTPGAAPARGRPPGSAPSQTGGGLPAPQVDRGAE